MRILFLDDDIIRKNQIEQKLKLYKNVQMDWVQTVKEAINCLQINKYDCIMLDHDLGGKIMVQSGEGTGYEVAQWIERNIKDYPLIYIHTHNPVGAINMNRVLTKAKIVPFYILLENL